MGCGLRSSRTARHAKTPVRAAVRRRAAANGFAFTSHIGRKIWASVHTISPCLRVSVAHLTPARSSQPLRNGGLRVGRSLRGGPGVLAGQRTRIRAALPLKARSTLISPS